MTNIPDVSIPDVSLLTKEELAEYRAANLTIATLESKISYREIQQWKKEQEKAEKPEVIKEKEIRLGVEVCKLFYDVGLCESVSKAKKLIKQGGLYINGNRVENPYLIIDRKDAIDNNLKLRRGKKKFFTIDINKIKI